LESANEELVVTSNTILTPTFSRSNSLKKQQVHWPDRSTNLGMIDLHTIKNISLMARKSSYFDESIVQTPLNTESSGAQRCSTIIPTSSSALSHVIQTATIPAGSTMAGAGANEFIASCSHLTSISPHLNSIV
jgi:hypothetical protein